MNSKMFTVEKQVPEDPLLLEDVVPLPKGMVGLAVLGSPIKHSISPQLHAAALEVLSNRLPQFSKWVYHKIQVESSDLSPALIRLAECGYIGLNLTIPHKVDVIKLIESVDSEAEMIGAVNTLFYDQSQWKGFNSDGYGLGKALLDRFGFSFDSAEILILGAGGAARAAAAQALSQKCKNLWIGNRSISRLDSLKRKLGEFFDIDKILTFNLGEPPSGLLSIENLLVINCTSLGLKSTDPLPVSLSRFHPTTKVYDMVYNPSQTKLIQEGLDLGMDCENGLSMLVHQASKSLSIWTENEISSDAMFLAAEKALEY